MILKKIYRILILPYTILLLYFMFLGFGREVMSINIVRLKPLMSTFDFVKNSLFLKNIIINLGGNIGMFIPFGFLGWVFPKFNDYKTLILNFVFAIIVVETLQYFSRLGVFDIDDVLINTLGVSLGFLLKKIIENKIYPQFYKD